MHIHIDIHSCTHTYTGAYNINMYTLMLIPCLKKHGFERIYRYRHSIYNSLSLTPEQNKIFRPFQRVLNRKLFLREPIIRTAENHLMSERLGRLTSQELQLERFSGYKPHIIIFRPLDYLTLSPCQTLLLTEILIEHPKLRK